jgi:hypothetical protein
MLCIFLLDLCGIHQHDFNDISRSIGTDYPTVKPFAYQLGEQAAMVQMGMGKKNSIQGIWRNMKRFPVSIAAFPLLAKPAVYQKPQVVCFNEISRAGNILRCAQKI